MRSTSGGPADSTADDVEMEDTGVPVGGLRKMASSVRPWLVLDTEGRMQVVEAGKHAIMRRTGLLARDLRILDPQLSYPSTVLGRDRAIVTKLEHVKAIIMAHEVLLLNSQDPSVTPFVDEIQSRIMRHYNADKSQEAGDGGNADLYNFGGPGSVSAVTDTNNFKSEEGLEKKEETGEVLENRDDPKLLPFEFVALEACLEAACAFLESEAKTLELEALPALDKLTAEVSAMNLERVRQIKSRLVSITGRVQKVRDELEHLLDDDQDMAEMYLTEKLHEQYENLSISSWNNHHDDLEDADSLHGGAGEALTEPISESIVADADLHRADQDAESQRSMQSGVIKPHHVEELEMLLEPYFVQIEGILDRLSTLREYVDDTEDYINIMLDDMQNQLLRMGILLTTAGLVMSMFITVTGIMAMNVRISIFYDTVHGDRNLLLLCVGCTIVFSVMYAVFIVWYRRRGLLE